MTPEQKKLLQNLDRCECKQCEDLHWASGVAIKRLDKESQSWKRSYLNIHACYTKLKEALDYD